MHTRHEYALLDRFDQVYLVGSAPLRHSEIQLWWQRDRIKTAVWREIADKWKRYLDDVGHDEVPLKICEFETGNYLLVWGQDLERWTSNIEDGPRLVTKTTKD